MTRWLLRLVVALVALVLPARALAQGHANVTAQLDQDTLQVGEWVTLTLQATTDSDMPSDPQPGATAGFVVRATGEMPMHSSWNINGVRTERFQYTATWQLRPTKTGTFTIGPPSVAVGKRRIAAKPLKITVVPAGSLPSPQRQAPSPFPFRFFGDDDDLRAPEPRIEADPKLALPVARAPVAFLHAMVDKTNAVLGEQVTYSVYLYIDASEREPDFNDVHEAPAPDFVRRSMQDNDTQAAHVGTAMVGGAAGATSTAGGRLYSVKLLRRSALFPLKTGDLDIGAMTVVVNKTRSANGIRTSEALKVHVTDAPAAGKPPGFVPGTVGKMELAAEVSPRETPAGGAVAITVDLAGTGNLPASLALPTMDGVEWLEPQIREKLGAQGERYGGKRTFSYVVKLFKEGTTDLGEIAIPFYNPESSAYDVARVALGSVRVTPGVVDRTTPDAPKALADLPAPAKGLEGSAGPRRHWTDSPWAWLGMCAAPLAWAFAVGARGATRRLREKAAARAASPETELKARIAAAEQACSRGSKESAREITAAIARALEAATIARVGVNLRGGTTDEVRDELSEAGVADDRIRAIVELVRECESARFAPTEGDPEEAKARWARARAEIDALPRTNA